jgi:hypothetical protein
LFKHTRTIDDASKAPAQHVQQSADTRQKKYGSNRKLNEVRDLINFIHEHIRVSTPSNGERHEVCPPQLNTGFW